MARRGSQSYRIRESEDGYKAERIGKPREGNLESAASELDPSEKSSVEEELERETLQETRIGIPGFGARKYIERYEEGGREIHDYGMELQVLGLSITLEEGTVDHSEEATQTDLEKELEEAREENKLEAEKA